MKKPLFPILVVIMSVLLISSLVFADGDTRKATQKEKDFYRMVMETFTKALPAGPEGWSEEKNQFTELELVTPDCEKYPFRVNHGASWTDDTRKQAADEEMQKVLGPKMISNSSNPELKKLMEQNDKLAKEFGDAVGKNDKPTVERLQKEMDALSKKFQAITDANDKESDSIMEKMSARDVSIKVSIQVNNLSEGLNESVVQEAPVAGCLTYRSQGRWAKENGWLEGTTYVLLGKGWQLKTDGGTYIETKAQKEIPSTAVQTILISVQADTARAKKVLEKINWNALKKLIQN
jgi:seryl-tRNA synthetase